MAQRFASCLVLLSCTAVPPTDLGSRPAPIIDGEDENGAPGTVMLLADLGEAGGILCSGSIIADNVVLTAKHCVDDTSADAWTVQTGGTGSGDEFTVSEFRMPSGALETDEDIACMILNESTGIDPYDYMRSLPSGFSGDSITLIGYGETETGATGRKKTVTDAVAYVDDYWFLTDGGGACHGDSGGTALHVDTDTVAGVIAFTVDDCDNGETGITRTDTYITLLDDALDDAAAGCSITGEEVCGNGLDEDCLGGADDGCGVLGQSCSIDDDCTSTMCRTIAAASVCTQGCDWLRPVTTCPSSAHCEVGVVSGEPEVGYCVLGAPGAGAIGEKCAAATDCANASCLPDGEGVTRCLDPCMDGGAGCEAGETCQLVEGTSHGGCVPGLGGQGSPCSSDGECESELCAQDGTGRFCSVECGDECPEGYECGDDGVCVHVRRPGRDGDPCETDADCESGLCASAADGTEFCSDECSEEEPCPEDYRCEAGTDADLCMPDLGLLGQPCQDNPECMSNLCGHFGPEVWGGPEEIDVCTSYCSDVAPCPGDFVCHEFPEYWLCLPPPPATGRAQKKEYGCGCDVAGPPDLAFGLALPLLALWGLRPRRRS